MKWRTLLNLGFLDWKATGLYDTLPSNLHGIGEHYHNARQEDYHVNQLQFEAGWMTSD